MKNQLKTVLLLGLLTAILLWVGQYFGGTTGLTFALFFVLILNFVTYWFSDKIVLAMYRAKEVDKNSKIYNLVRELARQAKLPVPKVYLIPTDNPNAFATGRNPKNAAIAATAGILSLLDDTELSGVIAHELAHIKHRDILTGTIAATLAGAVAMITQFARFSNQGGGRRKNPMGDRQENRVSRVRQQIR